MRLAVSGNGYATATNQFVDANHLTASAAHALMSALTHSSAMAGHTAATFAASYDAAAGQGVRALVDLTDALANLGRMTEATRRNHAYAEARAVIGRTPALADEPAPPSYAQLEFQNPPSAAGTHGPELPHWEAWILDHIEGFVWPDSDTDRLRATARAWRTATSQLELVKARCLDAALSLSIEIAPDVELAANATRRLATHVDSLAQNLHGLGRACDDLADEVDHHRQQVLDIVRDTLRDALVVEGIGLVLGAVTGGVTAAAASSLNSARIAAIAPRILRILEALRIAIGASETGARLAAQGVIDARASFQAFLNARIVLSDRGAAMPFYWYEAAKNGARLLKRAPGWLLAQENPGHTFEKHVGRTMAELSDRFIRDPHIPYSSSFATQVDAERLTAEVLDRRAPDIQAWLAGNGTRKSFVAELHAPTGTSVDPFGNILAPTGVRVFLVRDASMAEGFRVHTSFPQPIP